VISRGARNHPITRGVICSKGKSFVERAYSPERLEANVSTRDPSAPVVPWSDGKFSTRFREDRAVVPKFQAAR